jgi:serine/threonine-protein kinase
MSISSPGRLGGRYELEVILGRGAFGEVWRGKDRAARRPVAVKIIQLGAIGTPGLLAETIARFRREATVLAGLKHPSIVAALDAGRHGNQLFLVMELAQGMSLASFMTQRGEAGAGLFPVSDVLRIAEQVCAGLAAAHAAGVVHRDIKPSNLMASARLGIKIVDFGIVRLLDDNSPRLTLPRTALGTVAYMSPEQAMGGDVDGRADLYSLGCVLYELLTGAPPFLDEAADAVLMMQAESTPVPLRAVRPGLPAGLGELVGDLLKKEPAARPADAAEVIRRIAAIRRGLGGDPPRHGIDRPTRQAGDLDANRAEAGKLTRLAPETFEDPAGTGSAAADEPEWTPAPSGTLVLPAATAGQVPPPAGRRGPGSHGWPAVPSSRRSRRSGRSRRRRWRGAFSTLLTLAIVAAVAACLWKAQHESLPRGNVIVGVVRATPGCAAAAAYPCRS